VVLGGDHRNHQDENLIGFTSSRFDYQLSLFPLPCYQPISFVSLSSVDFPHFLL
jgi:hypothetical protein